jgi:hypothetical protein
MDNQDVKKEITELKNFLYEHMPTKEEMQSGFNALRKELASKKDLDLLRNAVDAYAKQSKDYYQEVTVLVAKVQRMEAWIQQAAVKLGVEYQK